MRYSGTKNSRKTLLPVKGQEEEMELPVPDKSWAKKRRELPGRSCYHGQLVKKP